MSLRVLIAVTHLLGAGHLTRAGALGRAFARKGHGVTLVSGGMPSRLLDFGRMRLVQLPPVRIAGTEFGTLLDETGRPAGDDCLAERRRLLLRTFEEARPDVVVTELFPFGRRVLTGEFLGLVEAAHARTPRPLILSSVRDILVAPAKAERVTEAHRRARALYDAVLVHGDPALVPLDASWPVTDEIRPLLRYTGYVDEARDVSSSGSTSEDVATSPPPVSTDEILVSAGSSATGLPLLRAAAEAASLMSGRRWRILAGAGVDEEALAELRKASRGHAIVERARPDFRDLLGWAAVSVSQAGYNTAVDLLRSGTRAVLVPFEGGRETEQRLRAERLAGAGLARILAESDLSAEALAGVIAAAIESPIRGAHSFRLDGAEASVAITEALVAARHPPLPRRLPSGPDWRPLDEALARAADRAEPVRFWWRDDDAVAATTDLDLLLDLGRRYEIPMALAVIPARIEPSLEPRLRDEPLVTALVHGLTHADHAPPGTKKAEFGEGRPIERMEWEVQEALALCRTALGSKMQPVFVPPWNRIARRLVPRLSAVGISALSTFGDRRSAEAAPELPQINTHIDPIDWHGTRGLVEPDLLIMRIARAVEARCGVADDRATTDAHEPIGILSHHLVHDLEVWHCLESLAERITRCEAATWSTLVDGLTGKRPPALI